MGMKTNTSDLIAMGVDVLSQDDESGRPFPELLDVVQSQLVTNEASGVREILAMLRDAADSAADIHAQMRPEAESLRRFSILISSALKELA